MFLKKFISFSIDKFDEILALLYCSNVNTINRKEFPKLTLSTKCKVMAVYCKQTKFNFINIKMKSLTLEKLTIRINSRKRKLTAFSRFLLLETTMNIYSEAGCSRNNYN